MKPPIDPNFIKTSYDHSYQHGSAQNDAGVRRRRADKTARDQLDALNKHFEFRITEDNVNSHQKRYLGRRFPHRYPHWVERYHLTPIPDTVDNPDDGVWGGSQVSTWDEGESQGSTWDNYSNPYFTPNRPSASNLEESSTQSSIPIWDASFEDRFQSDQVSTQSGVPTLDAQPEVPALNTQSETPILNAQFEVPTLDAQPELPALITQSEVPILNAQSEVPTLDAATTHNRIDTAISIKRDDFPDEASYYNYKVERVLALFPPAFTAPLDN